MHPSQMSGFRKTVIAALTILFAGALLVFTAQANIDLLTTVYPDQRFVMFGLLALEGGVVYWTGYYLLHASGVHKGLAVIALAIDALLSGIGFFYEMEQVTKSVGTVQLPPVIVVVAGAVLFNVAMSILSHLIPAGPYVAPRPHDDGPYVREYQPAQLEQRASFSEEPTEKRPGLLTQAAASVVAAGAGIMDQAREKRAARKDEEPEPVPALKRPLPSSSASSRVRHRPFIQGQPSRPSQARLKQQKQADQ